MFCVIKFYNCVTSSSRLFRHPAFLMSMPYFLINASATIVPPLVETGLLKLFVTTSTDMPGSIRMPLQFFKCFVVILNKAIFLSLF